MKYAGMPFGMWVLFAGSFQKQLTEVLGYDTDTAKAITKKAKPKYKAIIADLPEFEKAGAICPHSCAVPSGLHHERSRRRDKFCAAVYPCFRRTLLRLRVQKERVTDDEEEGNLSFP